MAHLNFKLGFKLCESWWLKWQRTLCRVHNSWSPFSLKGCHNSFSFPPLLQPLSDWSDIFDLSNLFLRLFIDGDRVMDPAVREHLQLDSTLEPEFKIQVMPYGSILSELQAVGAGLSPKEKVWLSDKASYALTEAIPKVSGPSKGKCFSLLCSPWLGRVLMRAAGLSFPSAKPSAGWSLCRRDPAMLRYQGVANLRVAPAGAALPTR